MDRDIEKLTVPIELVLQTSGFGLDIGGSLVKLVFRTEEDLKDAELKKAGSLGTLHTVCVPRADWESCLDEIKARYASRTNPETIFTSGVGSFGFHEQIGQKFDCRISNVGEFDCFIFALNYLIKNLPRQELLHSFPVEEINEPTQYVFDISKRVRETNKRGESRRKLRLAPLELDLLKKAALGPVRKTLDSTLPLAESEKDSLYPYMVAMTGSALGYFKVEEDGEFSMVDLSARCGRFLYGVGTLLTKCKSFEELLDLASTGNEKNVNTGLLDLVMGSEATGMYADLLKGKQNVCVYSFGKTGGVDPGQFSKEDLARAIVHHTALDIAQSCVSIAQVNRCKRVFFVGNVVSSDLIRREIIREVARKNATLFSLLEEDDPQTKGITIDFVNAGGYLGAIGCILNTVHPFVEEPNTVAE